MEKKVSLRKCIACMERKPKKELVRIVKHPENGIMIDVTGKTNGRGAYLCRDMVCIEKAEKKDLLKMALKTPISKDFYEEIKRHVEDR